MTTDNHLDAWLEREFPDCSDDLKNRMLSLVETDPEHWLNKGWWGVYDGVVASAIDANSPVKTFAARSF